MRSLSSVLLLLLLVGAEAGRRAKTPKGGNPDRSQPASDCPPAETRYGKCVPEQGDCGDGLREATCRGTSTQIHCRVPCNWKKDISDCKYKFERWSPCDGATNTKTRSGKLKRALFNAECQTSVKVSKPCSHKAKKPRGEKKSN